MSRNAYILFMLLLTSLGGVLYGYDIGVISGAMLFIKNEMALSDIQISLIVAAVLYGGAVATFLSGFLADLFGRRSMLIVAVLIFVVGVFLLISAHSFAVVLIGRLIQGIGIGIVIMVIPLYLVEAAPAAIRGRSVSLFQLFLTAGILLAYIINLIFAASGSWRNMFATVLLPTVFLLVGSFFLTESPRWLMIKGKVAEAKKALLKARSQEEAEKDFSIITQLLHKPEQDRKISIWQKSYMLPLFIALSIAILNQMTGINSFLQFSALIIQQSGISSNIAAIMGSVSIGLINFVVTIFAIFLIDKAGRKPLLTIGTAGTAISLIYLALVATFTHASILQGYLIVVGMLVFITFFAIGPGVVVWLALSELLPTAVRGMGIAICLAANSLVSASLASVFKYFSYVTDFWLCAACTVVYYLIARYLLPETKNRSLEEIEQHFKRVTEAK